jgi:menaquinone-dependent protoporphyrinogen oxidase
VLRVTLPILVSYSTLTGATGEVAGFIAAIIRESQLPVELVRMRDLKKFGQYRAAILGAPLYWRGMPAETHRFLSRHQQPLSALKTWAFVLGPILDKPWSFRHAGWKAAEELERYSWLQPAELKILGGRFDVKRLPFPLSLARFIPTAGKHLPPSDMRDWNEIRAWAWHIAGKLNWRNEWRTRPAEIVRTAAIA